MAEAVYLLCAIASALCAVLLFRGYRASGTRLLLWSSVCFFGLALNNCLLFIDLVVVPNVDLRVWRSVIAFASLLVLLVGLVME
jgi:hypothetical protein